MNQKEETNDVESSTAKVVSDDEEDDSDPYEATIPEIDVLRTFSPLIVHRQVHKSASRRFRAYCQVHFGAVLFADISGFTRLANLLSVEQLQYHISKYFKMLFGCVEKFGGDILKICGDAIMIMWPLAENESKSSLQYRSACALTACLCGRELILSCGLYAAFHGDVEIKLSLHCGVGVADVPCYWVGKSGRWEFLITGDALQQIASTEPEAQSGEIVVSPQVYELVSKHLVGVPTPAGNFLLTSEIKQCNEQEPLVVDDAVLKAFAIDDIDRFDRAPIKSLSDHPTLQFDLNRGIATSYLHMYARANPKSLSMLRENESTGLGLQHYIHNSARLRLRHLGRDFQMAELREVVTLFVNITGLEDDFKNQRLDVIQDIMAAIIDSHKPFGGTLRQFVVDDKGCVAIGALGLPHHTFEDNSARAVEIANIMRGRIQSLGKNCSIGISRGAAFCGLVGSSTRREYAMMGSCVNLAARLMCSCPLGQIVVDERVRASACDVLLFEDMGFVKAKGYADPVSIFAYREALLIPLDLNFLADDDGDTMMVGRKVQLDSLRLSLRDFLEGNPGCSHQFHFIEGEEGIGE